MSHKGTQKLRIWGVGIYLFGTFSPLLYVKENSGAFIGTIAVVIWFISMTIFTILLMKIWKIEDQNMKELWEAYHHTYKHDPAREISTTNTTNPNQNPRISE